MVIELMLGAAMIAAEPEDVSVDGPEGPVVGTLIDPSPEAPAIILIAGSGPTDRNGDNAIQGKGKIYEQLALALADKGIATVRYDKRGMFASKDAIADPNDVRLADYASDARAYAALLGERGKPCAWLMGHSEGGIVSVVAAQDPAPWCGVILLASPGRPIGVLLREQLGRQLPASMMKDVEPVIASLEAGKSPDTSQLVPGVAMIFNPAVEGYLIDMATTDPAALAGKTKLPLLIVHFEEDLQVVAADADAFAAARPDATRVDIPGVNHAFKPVEPGNVAANAASYNDADLKIDPRIAEVIADFVLAER